MSGCSIAKRIGTAENPAGRLPIASHVSDGKRIAFGSDDGKEASIWIYELSGTSSMRRLTFEGHNGFPSGPRTAGGRQRVAFHRIARGTCGIFWQRADGTGTAVRLTKADEGSRMCGIVGSKWRAIPVQRHQGRGDLTLGFHCRTRRRPLRCGRVSGHHTDGAVFRGRSLGGLCLREGRTRGAVYVQPFPPTGAKYLISKNADDGHHPVWSPDAPSSCSCRARVLI